MGRLTKGVVMMSHALRFEIALDVVQCFIIDAIRAPLVYTPSKTEAPLASKGLSVAAIGFESPSVIGFVSLLFGSFEKICGQEWPKSRHRCLSALI